MPVEAVIITIKKTKCTKSQDNAYMQTIMKIWYNVKHTSYLFNYCLVPIYGNILNGINEMKIS